jgi:GH25 family lysozyme M1 (1,4-beta-N-acetylmuramidase)
VESTGSSWKPPYYETSAFTQVNGRNIFDGESGTATKTGIDVSDNQGYIDWYNVAADGIEFAFIRVGYRGATEGGLYTDEYFDYNLNAAAEAGIERGAYFFSQATTADEAREEADFVISTLGSNGLSYPVAFDMEPSTSGSDRISSLSNDKRNAAARAFCKELSSKGYNAIVYGSRSDLASYDLSDFIDYGFWFADYSDHPMMSLRLGIWQYSDEATVDGIPEKVDLDLDLMDVLARAEAEKGEGSSGTDKRSN